MASAGLEHELVIRHFSHDHALHLVQFAKDEEREGRDCKACGGSFFPSPDSVQQTQLYSCGEECCDYLLHVGCAELPTEINHVSDEHHHCLLLVASKAEGCFWYCNACLEEIEPEEFKYECRSCEIDLHPRCANMPVDVQIPSHPHALTLVTNPAGTYSHGYQCDLCGLFGRFRWFYACTPCDFTVDIECALKGGRNSNCETSPHHPVIEHFCHKHPLYLLVFEDADTEEENPKTHEDENSTEEEDRQSMEGGKGTEDQNRNQEWNGTCSGCKKEIEEDTEFYCCIVDDCSYILHAGCALLRTMIDHPVDKNHYLLLVEATPYPENIFTCTACHKMGEGFLYRCAPCGIDLHPSCAQMPLQINHPAYRKHTLALSFKPASMGLGFLCDVCGEHGRKRWYYRCKSCTGIQMHADCAFKGLENPNGAAARGGRGTRRVFTEALKILAKAAAEELLKDSIKKALN